MTQWVDKYKKKFKKANEQLAKEHEEEIRAHPILKG